MLISHDKDSLAALESRSFRRFTLGALLRRVWTAILGLFGR